MTEKAATAHAALECPSLDGARVVAIEGHEAMGELSHFSVDVVVSAGDVDMAALIGQEVALGLFDEDGGARSIALRVSEVRYACEAREGHRYRLGLTTRLQPLTLRSGYRIWQKKTTQQIVQAMLEELGVESSSIVWRLRGQYGERVHCVQYGESDWAFVTRLLADDGINLWFDHSDDAPEVVFGDNHGAHASIAGDHHVRYEDPSALRTSASSIFELTHACELAHDAVHVRDFDIRQPDVFIEGKAGAGTFEHFEFPANVQNAEQAQARAEARLMQLSRFAVRVEAKSGNARFQPGRVIHIEGACDPMFHGDYLIVSLHHRLRQQTETGDTLAYRNEPYRNEAVLVPFGGKRIYRPALPKDAPRVDGLETAVVTGEGGDEITVSDLGEVHARFRWDRSGIADHKSSRWMRCMQMNMGGSMLLPRVGWEVQVAYVDGNPDQPFVLGRLYNSSNAMPYGLPGKAATSTLQSATSPDDGTTHEIRVADDAGAMEMFIHATKDQTVTVGGNHTVAVDVDETHDVKKSAVLAVAGAQKANIGGNQSVIVGANASLVVEGARDETIGGMESIGVKATYNLAIAGAYKEGIVGAYGIECNQSNTVIQGSFNQVVGGSMVQVAGLGTNQSCAAMRLEKVGGARTIIAKLSMADSVIGVKSVKAGACEETAKGDMVTNVKGVVSIKVGADAKLVADGPLVVEAPRITLKSNDTITCKGGPTLTIGGKVETSGKTKFDADKTHKKSTSKVG